MRRTCPDCGRALRRRARSCPSCGLRTARDGAFPPCPACGGAVAPETSRMDLIVPLAALAGLTILISRPLYFRLGIPLLAGLPTVSLIGLFLVLGGMRFVRERLEVCTGCGEIRTGRRRSEWLAERRARGLLVFSLVAVVIPPLAILGVVLLITRTGQRSGHLIGLGIVYPVLLFVLARLMLEAFRPAARPLRLAEYRLLWRRLRRRKRSSAE